MSFTDQLIDFSEFGPEMANQAVRKVFIDISVDVIKLTPVDQGRAKSNWHPMIHVEDSSVDKAPFDNSGRGGISPSSTSNISQEAGKLKGDGSLYLSNNLPYIQELEDGHSDQAPSGMVKTVMANIENYLP